MKYYNYSLFLNSHLFLKSTNISLCAMSRLDLVTFQFYVGCRCAIGIVTKWCDFPPCDVTFLHLAIPLGDVTFLRVMWLKPGVSTWGKSIQFDDIFLFQMGWWNTTTNDSILLSRYGSTTGCFSKSGRKKPFIPAWQQFCPLKKVIQTIGFAKGGRIPTDPWNIPEARPSRIYLFMVWKINSYV